MSGNYPRYHTASDQGRPENACELADACASKIGNDVCRESSQSSFSRRRSWDPISARYQSAAEGDAAAGRQADHSVRRRRGAALRDQNIIIVTGRGKSAIEDHFDVSFELENLLETRHKKDLLKIVRQVSDLIDVSYIRQKEALGLGHAVLRAQELVGRSRSPWCWRTT